jgi:hypothetical protein
VDGVTQRPSSAVIVSIVAEGLGRVTTQGSARASGPGTGVNGGGVGADARAAAKESHAVDASSAQARSTGTRIRAAGNTARRRLHRMDIRHRSRGANETPRCGSLAGRPIDRSTAIGL